MLPGVPFLFERRHRYHQYGSLFVKLSEPDAFHFSKVRLFLSFGCFKANLRWKG